MKKSIWIIIALVIVLPIMWYLISPIFNVIEAEDTSPLENTVNAPIETNEEEETETIEETIVEEKEEPSNEPTLLAEADFQEADHEVEGKALLIDTEDGKILRFEDFNTVNGPELHIYLSTDLEDNDFVDLGIIKATKGDVNYDVSSDIDTDKYNKVLVWCKPFGVLFSYADLS